MNIFVALYTVIAFVFTKGIWIVGAWYIVTKAVPFIKSLDLSILKSEEEEVTTEDWY
jgi:hypothetical protein